MKVTYNPRIIKQLGTELITSDSIALSELIKNSYDAKAKNIRIHFLDSLSELKPGKLLHPISNSVLGLFSNFKNKLIIIEDDGLGMDAKTLQKGFFEIGTNIKHDNVNTNDDATPILGNKGIGRLSAQRLSPILFVETKAREKAKSSVTVVKIDWEKLNTSMNHNADEWTFNDKSNYSYTRLWFWGNDTKPVDFSIFMEESESNPAEKLPDSENFKLKEDVLSTLNFIYSPFEKKHSLLNLKVFHNNKPMDSSINIDNLFIAEAIHSFKLKRDPDFEAGKDLMIELGLEIKPWFLQRIHNGMIGDRLYQDWKREPSFYAKLLKKYAVRFATSLNDKIPATVFINQKGIIRRKKNAGLDVDSNLSCLNDIADIEGRVYSFKRNPKLLQMAYDSAKAEKAISKNINIENIKNFLDVNNGIKLYRNNFRIASLGNKDSDWLKLQQKRTTGQQFYRFELGNVLGFVRVNDPRQKYISETSSREDIQDNPHTRAIHLLLDYIFNDRFYELNKNAVEICKDILDEENLIPHNTQKQILEEAKKAKELLAHTQNSFNAILQTFNTLKENISLDTPDKVDTVKRIVRSIDSITKPFTDGMNNTYSSLRATEQILAIAHEEKKTN